MTPTESTSQGLADRATAEFRAYQEGDEAALLRLVALLNPLLWHVARGCGLDADAAEDVVQETWVALWKGAERIHSPQAVLQWLLVTTRRRALTVAARTRRQAEPTDAAQLLETRADESPGPEEEALGRDGGQVLWRHYGALSQRCQALLRVIAQGGRPDYATLAAALGMPVGSIGPTRGRCLAKLRVALESDPRWSGGRSEG